MKFMSRGIATAVQFGDGVLLDGGIDDKKVNLKYIKRAQKSVERLIYIIQDLDLTLQSLNYTKKEIKNLFPKLINDIKNNKNSTQVKNTISFEKL